MKKYFVFAAAGLVIVLLSLSCDRKGASNAGQETRTAGAFTPLVFDNYGRTVTVTGRPEKVLALGPNCAETLVALGLADYIAGTSLRNHSRGPLPQYEEAFKRIPELNHGSATREAVISSGADFIYGIDWEFGGDGLDIDELAGYGMTVYMDAAQTLEQTYQEINDIGKIFGVEDRAATFVAGQKARIASVKQKLEGRAPVKVLVYDSGNDGVFTCSGANFETLLINESGGKNVFDDLREKAWVTVSYEEVLKRSPEAIIIHDYDSPSVEAKLAEIKANDTLSQLDAVRNNRFVIIELESVLPGDRLAYTVEKLAKGLPPEISF
ncbi:MAG: ABC transporter substrate-binding protein [Treponema sp.]|jgi:iron complex transport system substrate-binding protein|nr:ABC transporter substrate-binding protein [Treponema sp.]